MTVPATARRAGPYNGNGATTSFSFSFKTFAAGDLLVTRTNASGVETALVLNSDYSVTLNGDQDASPGGSITYPISGSPLPSGQKLTIVGDLEYEQTTDLLGGGAFNARTIEDTFDRTVMQIQQLEERADRALTLPVSSTASTVLPAPEADQVIGWNSTADALVNIDPASLASVTASAYVVVDKFTGDGTTTQFVCSQLPGSTNAAEVTIAGVMQNPTVDYTVSGARVVFTSAPANGTVIIVRFLVAASQSSGAAFTTERHVATGGQTVFNLANAYAPGADTLSVFVNGLLMSSAIDYSETSANVVTFTSGLTLNDEVVFHIWRTNTVTVSDIANASFIQAGTGAVTRTAQAKMRDVVSVKDFGAVGDGVTNDTAAIQAALTAGAGKSVYFPAGSYAINAALSVPANTYVYAESGTATVTQSTAAGTNAFTLAGDNITIDGLKIVGPNSGGGSAVRADSRNNPTVKNCQVQNWLFGIQLRGCTNWTVSGNRLWGGTYDSGSSSDIFIYGSTGAPSSRGIVTGNFCLSNNDNGISVDTNSGDKDLLISSNVVYPLQSDGVTPLADANNRRRYGIIVGYNGTVNTRAVVSANVVRDVPYSGIYMNASALPAGDVAITGNNVARCGFGTLYPSDSSLRAGIYCNGGADSITGNVIVDCSTAGIKVAPGFTYSSTNQPRAVISSNNVARTAGYGIWLTIKPHGYLVTGNRVINSTNYNIFYETTSADGGNCHFVGNHIDSNGSATGGIILANSLGGYSCSVTGNRINGSDNTTNDQFNSGIWFEGEVNCSSNIIVKFHRGINCATSLGRNLSIQCASNHIENCPFGINSSGAGPWVVIGNTFDTVTTPLNGSAWQGSILQASSSGGFGGVSVLVADTSAPTTGTWAVGDHCAKTNPAVGQPKGWFCTVAGTPGTWTSEGNL